MFCSKFDGRKTGLSRYENSLDWKHFSDSAFTCCRFFLGRKHTTSCLIACNTRRIKIWKRKRQYYNMEDFYSFLHSQSRNTQNWGNSINPFRRCRQQLSAALVCLFRISDNSSCWKNIVLDYIVIANIHKDGDDNVTSARQNLIIVHRKTKRSHGNRARATVRTENNEVNKT